MIKNSKSRRIQRLIIVGLLPVIGSILALSYNIYQYNQTERIQNIRQEIQTKINQANALNTAMNEIRKQNTISNYFCNNLSLIQNDKQEIYNLAINRFNAIYNLVEVNYQTPLIFGNDTYQKTLSFLALTNQEATAICSKDIPTDDQMRAIQGTVNDSIQPSIAESENKLNKLISSHFIF